MLFGAHAHRNPVSSLISCDTYITRTHQCAPSSQRQEAMPPKAWLPVFEPGAGWQRLRGMQGEAPCPVSRGGALWAGCRVTTPAQSPEAERSGPRHFAGFRRKTESVIVGSYTFAESAVPSSPRAPNETHHTTKERLTIKSQAEMRGKVRKI